MLDQMKPEALKRIQNSLVLEAIAKAENIEISDERVDEVLGLDNAGVNDHGHALVIAQALHQAAQAGVGHLVRDLGVTQQAAKDRQGGVQRVEACGDLHGVRAVHGLAIGEDDAAVL